MSGAHQIWISWILNMLPVCSIFMVSVFFHEFGHYIIAKKEGKYKGWGILPQPHIKLNGFGSRWGYLAGFLFSMIALPLWIWVFGLELYWAFIFILLQIGAAGADFFVFIYYGRLTKK